MPMFIDNLTKKCLQEKKIPVLTNRTNKFIIIKIKEYETKTLKALSKSLSLININSIKEFRFEAIHLLDYYFLVLSKKEYAEVKY